MRLFFKLFPIFILSITFLSGYSFAQNVIVDASASDMMYQVLFSMKSGASPEKVSNMLDSVLNTKPYQTMFKHYNRSWRPNHLPETVFKKMILSLQFPNEYTSGENQRADQMLPYWKNIYNNLSLYIKNLEELKKIDLNKSINEAISQAQKWLPSDWKIPDSYLFIHPNGGSNGFVINGAQGYDFLQIPRSPEGKLDLEKFIGIISHESHHLGLKHSNPKPMSPSDSLAYNFLTLFIGEGTSTKFVDNAPGGYVISVDPNRANNFIGELDSLWKKYTDEEPELVKRFINTFEKLYQGQMSEKEMESEINNYWLAGLKGPAYFLGSELFGAIYYGLGKEKCFDAMKNPEEMLDLYNKAVKKNPDILNNCFVIPNTVVQHALSLGNIN